MKTNGPGQSTILLLDIIDVLTKFDISYAIVGAFAASFYGVVRASIDTDAVISLPRAKNTLTELISALKKSGFKVTHRRGHAEDPVAAVINICDKFGNRVDLLEGIHGMTADVFTRTVTTTFMNTEIRMIGLEDFIAMKIFAGSPKDLADVEGALKVSSKKIDLSLLKKLTQNYGRKELKKLESMLN